VPLQAAHHHRPPIRHREGEGLYGCLLQTDQGDVGESKAGISPSVHVAGMLQPALGLPCVGLLFFGQLEQTWFSVVV
jgi:hypothetical protein